ncbi:hypothetical protein ACHQM5_013485 [Ranunculus cassubicifolius]
MDKHTAETTESGGRSIRFRYLRVKKLINDEKDEIANMDSNMFDSLMGELNHIHEQVGQPREQAEDASAFLDLVSILSSRIKAEGNQGIKPYDFVTALLQLYKITGDPRALFPWGDFGYSASGVFRKALGCCTMVGPMNIQPKQRKTNVRKKRDDQSTTARPQELENPDVERNETDKNIATMFDILKKRRSVKLECLVLNRDSFAQTVENLFALSFLAKDGRICINVGDNNCHLVSPRNAPASKNVTSKEVSNSHFLFRLDFQDWLLMMGFVGVGEELMPNRCCAEKLV